MEYSFQPLADPAGASVLVAAVQWLQATLLGSVATTVAIIAVAAVGLMMLAGRIDWKRGAAVVIGCFILFGASSIVAGIRGATAETDAFGERSVAPSDSPLQIEPIRRTPAPYDPYAGAAVPGQ